MSKKTLKPIEVSTVNWKELKTNPYQQTLAYAMLSPEGMLIKKKVKLKGSTQYDEPIEVLVKYDEEFFLTKVKNILGGLFEDGMTLEQILTFVRLALLETDVNANL